MAAADQRHLNAKASITDIAAKVENDQPESVRKLAQEGKVSKKSAMWVTKLLYLKMKKEQVRACKAFIVINATVS